MGFTYKWWLLCIIARLRFPCILKQSSLANQLDYDFSIYFFFGVGDGGVGLYLWGDYSGGCTHGVPGRRLCMRGDYPWNVMVYWLQVSVLRKINIPQYRGFSWQPCWRAETFCIKIDLIFQGRELFALQHGSNDVT